MARKQPKKITIRRTKAKKAAPQSLVEDLRTFFLIFALFAGVALAGGAIWAWQSGWVARQAQHAGDDLLRVTGRAGFSIQDILVEGRSQTEKSEIVSVLKVEKGSPILAFDPHQALTQLQTLPWVKGGIVERRLPQTIFVKLVEREPLAIWQINRRLKLVDQDGHVLRDIGDGEALGLPLVVGNGANTHAAEIISQLKAQKTVMDRVRAIVRVSDRRWDLHMDNKVTIKLPEDAVPQALERLAQMMAQENILERRILGIDLRLPDRTVVSTDQDIAPPGKKGESKAP